MSRKIHVTLTEREADALLDFALEGQVDAEARYEPGRDATAYAAGSRAIFKLIRAQQPVAASDQTVGTTDEGGPYG